MEVDGQNWIKLLSDDKERAYRLLVSAYGQKVYNTCLRMTFHETDAQDLTQEVFTAIYLSIDSYKGDSTLSTWIYSITTNKAKEFIRYKLRDKRNAAQTSSLDWIRSNSGFDVSHENTPEEEFIQYERVQLLFAAIEELADNQRIAYTLNKLDGLSYGEVAEVMGLSLQSVESLLFRAKQNLKKILEKKLED